MKNSTLYLTLIIVFIFSLYLFTGNDDHPYVSSFEKMKIPEDNPFTIDKVELGRQLFFDKRLSINNSVSCATCHLPQFAFTDRKTTSRGVYGRKVDRNSPSLLNSGFLNTVMFDSLLTSLEMQVLVPIQEHKEMGMDIKVLMKKLKAISTYKKAAKSIFKRDFDSFVLTKSIAAFERTLLSTDSRFDQYYYGKIESKLTASEKRGWKLFSEKLYCIECHTEPLFSNDKIENNGLYADYTGKTDKGRFRLGQDSSEIGFFKIPSLRNIELTYPYMHDGSISTIDEVIDFYSQGGNQNNLQSKIIQPFQLSKSEKNDLIAFLISLTDTTYLVRFR